MVWAHEWMDMPHGIQELLIAYVIIWFRLLGFGLLTLPQKEEDLTTPLTKEKLHTLELICMELISI